MGRILIVEDDTLVHTVIGRWLEGDGHAVRAVDNGAAGLLAAHEDRPDLVIMDLLMPVLDGECAIRALRTSEVTAAIPIVVLSARSDDRALAEALTAGADVYLIKPPDRQALLAVVRRLLAGEADTTPA